MSINIYGSKINLSGSVAFSADSWPVSRKEIIGIATKNALVTAEKGGCLENKLKED